MLPSGTIGKAINAVDRGGTQTVTTLAEGVLLGFWSPTQILLKTTLELLQLRPRPHQPNICLVPGGGGLAPPHLGAGHTL